MLFKQRAIWSLSYKTKNKTKGFKMFPYLEIVGHISKVTDVWHLKYSETLCTEESWYFATMFINVVINKGKCFISCLDLKFFLQILEKLGMDWLLDACKKIICIYVNRSEDFVIKMFLSFRFVFRRFFLKLRRNSILSAKISQTPFIIIRVTKGS
jgi:hypothetical protein